MPYLPIDIIINRKAKEKHEIDALNLLAYTILLSFVVLTIWILKRRRSCLHETGLAIIYGMIMGACIRYMGLEIQTRSMNLINLLPNFEGPADYVIVNERVGGEANATDHFYAYEFKGETKGKTNLGSQIAYASVDPELFFNIILPPIVLNAGLSLKRRHFFRNIGAIFTYAFVGTTISVAIVGSTVYASIQAMKTFLNYPYLADTFSLSNCLQFGAIISPTDPLAVLAIFQELGVDVNLYALIFGESILNDAVSIVLTHTIDQFSITYSKNPHFPIATLILGCALTFVKMFTASCLIGVFFGVLTALTTKFTKLSEFPLLETSLIVLMSYSSFLTAEVTDTSGIVAILLCGVTQAHYTINNLSFEARERIRNLFEMLTFLCENFLFLAVGVAVWQRDMTWNWTFIGIAFGAVFVARALSVYPLSCLLNLGRYKKIPCSFQHVIAWGGGARGVISYSLAARNTVGEARRIILSATTIIVIVSVISVGSSINAMLRLCKIPSNGGKPRQQRSTSQQYQQQQHHHHQHRHQRDRIDSNISCSNTNGNCINAVDNEDNNQGHVSPSLDCCGDDMDSTSQCSNPTNINTPAITNNHHQHHHNRHHQQSTPTTTNTNYHSHRTANTNPTTSSHANTQLNQQNNNAAYQNASFVRRWRLIDNNYIKPLLTNSQPSLMQTLPSSMSGIAKLLTSEEQMAWSRFDDC